WRGRPCSPQVLQSTQRRLRGASSSPNEERNSQQIELDSYRRPPPILPPRLNCSGRFLRKLRDLGQTFWEEARELPVRFKQRFPIITIEKVIAVHPFALECGADPVVDGSRHQPNHLCGFSPLTESEHGFRAAAFPRRRESFNFPENHVIQIKVIGERRQISALLANDLSCRVFHDARAMDARLFLGSDKIFKRLANGPDAGVPFPCRAKEL